MVSKLENFPKEVLVSTGFLFFYVENDNWVDKGFSQYKADTL